MNKIIFWNINTQEDFFEETAMKSVNTAAIRPKLRAITEFAKSKNIKVVNVLSWNNPKAKWVSATPNYTETFPIHCVANSKGTNFIAETLVDADHFLIKGDEPYIVFPEIHKHRNLLLFKDGMNLIEGNRFADSVLNNLGTVIMVRPIYVVYGVGAGLIGRDLTRRGYTVKLVTDATAEFENLPINYEETGIEPITTEILFSSMLEE